MRCYKYRPCISRMHFLHVFPFLVVFVWAFMWVCSIFFVCVQSRFVASRFPITLQFGHAVKNDTHHNQKAFIELCMACSWVLLFRLTRRHQTWERPTTKKTPYRIPYIFFCSLRLSVCAFSFTTLCLLSLHPGYNLFAVISPYLLRGFGTWLQTTTTW